MTNSLDFIETEYQAMRAAAKDRLRVTIDYYRSVFASEYAHRMLCREAVRSYNSDKATARILRDVRLKDYLDARDAFAQKVIGDAKLAHSLVVFNAKMAHVTAEFTSTMMDLGSDAANAVPRRAARERYRARQRELFQEIESDVPAVQWLIRVADKHMVEFCLAVFETLSEPFEVVLGVAYDACYCEVFRDTIQHAVELGHLPPVALDLADDYDWSHGA